MIKELEPDNEPKFFIRGLTERIERSFSSKMQTPSDLEKKEARRKKFFALAIIVLGVVFYFNYPYIKNLQKEFFKTPIQQTSQKKIAKNVSITSKSVSITSKSVSITSKKTSKNTSSKKTSKNTSKTSHIKVHSTFSKNKPIFVIPGKSIVVVEISAMPKSLTIKTHNYLANSLSKQLKEKKLLDNIIWPTTVEEAYKKTKSLATEYKNIFTVKLSIKYENRQFGGEYFLYSNATLKKIGKDEKAFFQTQTNLKSLDLNIMVNKQDDWPALQSCLDKLIAFFVEKVEKL